MHPIWFMQWLWQKAWSQEGLLPLLEHNQGSLSLAALGLALVALVVENGRANKAQADALEAERARVEISRRAEAERRQYELEAQRRQAELAREAQIDRQIQVMAKFVRAANGIVLKVEKAVIDELNVVQASVTEGVTRLHPGAETKKAAMVAAHSLIAIIPAAPMDPDLITDVRRAALDLEWLGGEGQGVYRSDQAGAYLGEQREKLLKIRADLTEHNIALTSMLRPTPSLSDAATLPQPFDGDAFPTADATDARPEIPG